MTQEIKTIAILGGGISGLSLAYFLQEALKGKVKISLFESKQRVGGWIETLTRDDNLLEQGPRSLRANASLETLALVKKLKLEDKIILSRPDAQKRFLYVDGRLHALPTAAKDLIFSCLGRKILRAMVGDLVRKKTQGDISVYDFFYQRFSPFVADTLADALVSGVYAGDSKKLSMSAAFPTLYSWEQKYRSVLKGAFLEKKPKNPHLPDAHLFSCVEGMETLVTKLEEELSDIIFYGHKIEELKIKNGKFLLQAQERSMKADFVFSCLPAHNLLALIPFKNIRDILSRFISTSVAVVHCGFSKNIFEQRGFGYLIPSREKQKNIGVVWDSSVFPHMCRKNHHLLTVMLGGEHFHNFAAYDEQQFMEMACSSIHRQMGFSHRPTLINARIAHQAIPQYGLGHGDLVQELEKNTEEISPRFFILGSSFYGVAVNDGIKKSREIVDKILWQF